MNFPLCQPGPQTKPLGGWGRRQAFPADGSSPLGWSKVAWLTSSVRSALFFGCQGGKMFRKCPRGQGRQRVQCRGPAASSPLGGTRGRRWSPRACGWCRSRRATCGACCTPSPSTARAGCGSGLCSGWLEAGTAGEQGRVYTRQRFVLGGVQGLDRRDPPCPPWTPKGSEFSQLPTGKKIYHSVSIRPLEVPSNKRCVLNPLPK